jgi:hypothetical protein
MCPVCLSTAAWIVLGGGTGTGALAGLILAVRHRKPKEEPND